MSGHISQKGNLKTLCLFSGVGYIREGHSENVARMEISVCPVNIKYFNNILKGTQLHVARNYFKLYQSQAASRCHM